MDATLFHHNISLDRSLIDVQPGEKVSLEWCRRIANQQVRVAGFAGSWVYILGTFPPPPYPYINRGEVDIAAYSTRIYLPWGAFGTTFPPYIKTCLQWGNRLIYKNLEDRTNSLLQAVPGLTTGDGPVLRTFVDTLTPENGTIGGTVYARWGFTLGLRLHDHPSGYGGSFGVSEPVWKEWVKYMGWNYQDSSSVQPFWFVEYAYPYEPHTVNWRDGVTSCSIHWYCLGVDSNAPLGTGLPS